MKRKAYGQGSEEIANYAYQLLGNEDETLQEIRARAQALGLPDIHLAPVDGLHLEVLTRACNAKKAVEIGTLAGYSGVCIARALSSGGQLFTFEHNPKHAQVAQETFLKAGLSDKVKIFVGKALDNLKQIEAEGPFDLVFIDADKAGYPAYLAWAAENLRIGGTFLADNTFAFGAIANQADERREVLALREFNRLAVNNRRFKTTILPTGEGLTVGVKLF